MKILSDVHLMQLADELKAEVTGTPPPILDYMVRGTPDDGLIFPDGNNLCWQHRWFKGTGVRPPGWRFITE